MVPATQPDQNRPSLFLSYSRADSAFADELNISLESHGFEVYIDREDLFPGERFEPRLEALISEADTTVVILSPNWIASDYCQKELGIAQSLGRRIIPAIIQPVTLSDLPESVAKVQFVFFVGEGKSFARGLADLVTALRTDIDWVREQSRLYARVEDWERAGRSDALLLRGEALEAAQAWIARPPPAHVSVLPRVAAYISASDTVARDYRRRQARGRFVGLALASVAIISVLATGLFLVWSQGEIAAAEARRQFAELGLETERERTRAAEAEKEALELILANFNDTVGGDAADSEEADILLESSGDIASGAIGSGAIIGGMSGAGEDATTTPPPAETPTPAPAAPADRSPAPATPAGRLVANLNSSVKETRLSAGQEVVIALRSDAREAYLEELVAAIEPPAVRTLTTTGRFNTLYMLNVQPDWKGTRWESRLAAALDRMEAETAIGGQTRDCVDMLRAKLRGDSGTLNICGNVRNYGLDPQRR